MPQTNYNLHLKGFVGGADFDWDFVDEITDFADELAPKLTDAVASDMTGAGIGMKSDNRRNFEAGILTDDTEIVGSAIEQFDNVWMGSHCAQCGRKEFCHDCIK